MTTNMLLAASLMVVTAFSGCANWLAPRPALPARHTLVLDPLIVYSDFPLPPHHRLLDDVAAERGDLMSKLNLPKSEESIHVYLFDTEATFQAFVGQHFPEFPARRAFFVESDTRLAVYAHWGDRVSEDLRHEVAHGYLHAVVPQLPLWLDEGLAEYAEVPRGDAGVNRPHVNLLAARLAGDVWRPNLERLERLHLVADMTQLDYAESWAWVHLLMETDPARRELLQAYVQSLRRDGKAPPLSARLRPWFPQLDAMLADHIHALAEKP
ncbi:MAG TPA: hypothetical protein VMV69_25595 [Pirellulales bacterium]|nr:hypothetical protein [Pirellulales bacterium]